MYARHDVEPDHSRIHLCQMSVKCRSSVPPFIKSMKLTNMKRKKNEFECVCCVSDWCDLRCSIRISTMAMVIYQHHNMQRLLLRTKRASSDRYTILYIPNKCNNTSEMSIFLSNQIKQITQFRFQSREGKQMIQINQRLHLPTIIHFYCTRCVHSTKPTTMF